MKEVELRQYAKCGNCGQKILSRAGLPIFYLLTIERLGVDLRALQRQDGLAEYLRSTELARIMGPDAELTQPLMEPLKVAICEACSTDPKALPIAALVEVLADASEEDI